MAASEIGLDTVEETRVLAEAPHLSLLLGAGASVAAGLPSWDELALRLLQCAGAVEDIDTARAYLAQQDPTLAAEAARAACTDWPAVVRDALYGAGGRDSVPGALHLAAANLVVTRAPTTLFTLNFDDLLEEAVRGALDEVGNAANVVSRVAAMPRANADSYEVQHLHGLLPRDPSEPASSLVLTLSDFNNLGAQSHPWQSAALSDAMSKGPLVLAGTTHRDPDIRQSLHSIGEQVEDAGPTVFALVAREGLQLSKSQFNSVADAVRQQWSSIGIHAVLVQDHSDAAQVLREVTVMTAQGYRSPQQRASAMWGNLLADFGSHQDDHSARLDGDRSALPGPGTDLTLWISDGTAQLVRWASHDRVYRSAEKLRRVPMGYDSPWVAARSVARSEVIVERLNQPDDGARRWKTVVAAPILLELAGGPNLVCGALSAATASNLVSDEEIEWRTALADLVEQWGDYLARTC